jgi:copper chaperone CopZ
MGNTTTQKIASKEKMVLGGSLIAGIVASLCCIGPLVAIGLGLGSFGASAFFETLRPYLLVATFALLGISFYQVYRKPKTVCADGSCQVEGAGRWNKIALWIVTVFVIAFAAFPAYSGFFVAKGSKVALPPSGTQVAAVTNAPEPITTATLKVEGMTCAGCVANVQNALKKTPGVTSAQVSLDPPQAIVTYNPKQVQVETLIQAVQKAGYTAKQ